MAHRQKSFFDQQSKAYKPWRKEWKPGNAPRTVEPPPPKISGAKSPIAASSQSRSKLKAFQFRQDMGEPAPIDHRIEAQDVNKENVPPEQDQMTAATMDPPPQVSSQPSANKDLRECPQTPIGRLPLSQLLANGDDARQNLNITPVERVLWENSPATSEGAGSVPTRKRRRRGHSTSPTLSSQNEKSTHFGDSKRTLDAQALQALKTPKADPADDLWSRYSLHTSIARSPTALAELPIAQLMHSSSPQTPGSRRQGRDSGSLRRALSCIEWPTSTAKKRKLQHISSQNRTMTGLGIADGQTDLGKSSKMSRVSFLVEKLHEGLANPVDDRQYSSSEPARSSPVGREKPSLHRGATPSQRSNKAVEDFVPDLCQSAEAEIRPCEARVVLNAEEIANLNRSETSSEYGDDDLDLEMLDAVDHDEDSPPEIVYQEPARQAWDSLGSGDVKRSHGFSNGISLPKASSVEVDRKHFAPRLLAKPSIPVFPPDDPARDEFDEDGDEMSAADLEEVFARYDTQPSLHATKAAETGKGQLQNDAPLGTLNAYKENQAKVKADEAELLSENDEYGGDSDFEQIAAEFEATQPQEKKSRSQIFLDRKTPTLQRYIIKAVGESYFETSNGVEQPEKVLSVQCERTKLSKAVILRQAWIDTPCQPGAYVHLIGEFDHYGQCIVDNVQNLLILHPDHLVSSTVVGDSFTCIRKAVLQDRVKTSSDTNQATVYGHMLHEIFQEAMRANRWDDEFMIRTIDAIARRYLETLFEINIEHSMAVDQLKARVVDLQAWAELFVAAKPKPNAILRDRNGAQALMCVNKLLEVEEHVWSPLYGLKGNIDATVQITLIEGDGEKTLTVPFELKTGKHSSAAHKAQTSLYTLLLSDRYDVNIACGILYYMQSSEISSVRALRHEVVPMIVQRNKLADFIRHREKLPPMLKNPYTCGKCYAKTPCFIYHKLVDDGNGESSGVGEKFEELVKHLKPEHQIFFRKWDSLLTKEEKDIVKLRRELWTMQSSEREKVGRCFSGLVVDSSSSRENTDAPKINRFHYTLVKKIPTSGFSFTESQITLGEPIVISDENGHFALGNGFVTGVRKRSIQVTVDRRLHNARMKKKNFDSESNQVFTGIMEVIQEGSRSSTMTPAQTEEPVIYRLDKDEFSNGMALIRNNLIRLMEKDVFGVQALRKLIVEGVAPTFKPTASEYTLGDTASQASLNVDQRQAIEKVMSAKDYALVLGMPGTGKTTTIAHIIRALVAQGKSVLLTSYTHTAVDNILLKLRNDNIGIFRLGAIAKIHPEVQEFADLAGKPIKTVEELKTCYTQKVVATTCLGINHPIFNQRVFDYCIVDEASQITLPVCLGPIRMARTFVLVGDHYQLPPLVQNKEALSGGLDISLFKLLSDTHPESVVNLEHQYRMCSDIMTLSNTLIYSGRLKCGTLTVATRSLHIPNLAALTNHHLNPLSLLSHPTTSKTKPCPSAHPGICWLFDLLHPSTKAALINTDPLLPLSNETLESGSRITNPTEATLTTQLVEALLTTGVPARDIGVITLYRSQLALIKTLLRHRPGVEMHTADRFQGRDKEVVILSLVRSNDGQVVGDLLKDWRRVNVALTRARTKLLVLGSKRTLRGNGLLKEFVNLVEGRGWCYDLPPGACEGHFFEGGGATQGEGGGGGGGGAVEGEGVGLGKNGGGKVGLARGKEIRGVRVPGKQMKLDVNALMGRRPVLRDIVNEGV